MMNYCWRNDPLAFCICDSNFKHVQIGYWVAEIACLDITNGYVFRLLCPFLRRLKDWQSLRRRTHRKLYLCCLGAFCSEYAFQHVLCRGKGLPLEGEDKGYWSHMAASRSIQYFVKHPSSRIEQWSKLACDEGIPSSAPAWRIRSSAQTGKCEQDLEETASDDFGNIWSCIHVDAEGILSPRYRLFRTSSNTSFRTQVASVEGILSLRYRFSCTASTFSIRTQVDVEGSLSPRKIFHTHGTFSYRSHDNHPIKLYANSERIPWNCIQVYVH